eukprot:gene8009-9854_t
MEGFENIEELAHQILFDFKNKSSPMSPVKKSSKSTHNIFHSSLSQSQDIAFVPASPPTTSLLSSKLLLSSSTSSLKSSSSSVLYDQVPLLSESTSSLLPPIPSLCSSKSLIPSPCSSLSNSTESLSNSIDSLCCNTSSLSTSAHINNNLMISLSSSPSQSVPSSPPAFGKSMKFHNYSKSSSASNPSSPTATSFSPSSSYSNLLPSSPSSSPSVKSQNSSHHNNNNSNNPVHCTLNECLLCQRGQPDILVKSPTWASIMRVVFFTLHNEMKEKQFFSLKSDVYEFMTTHWDVLCLNKKRSDNWHKQIQDMLSHSKNIFESGMDKYKQNGFWRLKQISSPHLFDDLATRKRSSIDMLISTSVYDDFDMEEVVLSSPRKKRLSDSGEVQRSYVSDDHDELFIDESESH